jgi:hypothetical protein
MMTLLIEGLTIQGINKNLLLTSPNELQREGLGPALSVRYGHAVEEQPCLSLPERRQRWSHEHEPGHSRSIIANLTYDCRHEHLHFLL